jgi:hypothetical protein
MGEIVVPTVEERSLENANGGERFSRLGTSCQYWERGMALAISSGLILMLILQVSLLTTSAVAASVSQEQTQSTKRQPLGSLTATGEVYVNDKVAPAESTVFVGDTIRTGEASTAIFTMTGNGTLKIGAQSQVVVSGDLEFAAELQSGTAVIDSISGPSGIKLRVGSFVVVPAVRSRVTSARIEAQPAGTFQVTCLDGDISTLPVQGGSGRLLEAGQWVSISPGRGLVASKQSGVRSLGSSRSEPFKGRTGWTLLGLAGAGAGAAALVLTHGGGTPVSPSTP